MHAQNHGGSSPRVCTGGAPGLRGGHPAMDPPSLGMLPGPSVPGGHSVLAAMLFAAAPDEAGTQMRETDSGEQRMMEDPRFSSPSPSRVRSRASPSMSSSRQSKSWSSRSSKSSKQKKPSNKQPRDQVPRVSPRGIRGRVSVAERGRIVLEAMGSGAKAPLHTSPAQNDL